MTATIEPSGLPPRPLTVADLPDVLVGRDADRTDRDLPVAPLLAVDVLSPSTRLIDLSLCPADLLGRHRRGA